MNDSTRVEWRQWGPEAFEEAERSAQPILLSLTATWCGACHEMDARTYAEPRIAAHINDSFVPIRVDVDRHPRVRERYNMGGFPTTAFLTPEGELLSGATYLGPDGLRQVLESIRELWANKGTDAGRIPRALADDPTPSGELTTQIEQHLAGQLSEQFDSQHGGWGTEAKFPLARTIEFALKRERAQALQTLDAIAHHLYDSVEGGFFRFATSRDWSEIRYEKVLPENAALLRAFANAYLYTGDEAYRNPAGHTIEYLTNTLWTGIAVGGSQGPGQGAGYYSLEAADRAEHESPRTDLTVFAGGNALAADALLAYYSYTDDETAKTYARRILTALESELVDSETGVVTHYRAGDEVGETHLLEDAARVVGAWSRAYQVLGEDHYLEGARQVADEAIAELQADSGAFRDGPAHGEGLCGRPLYPIDTAVEFADGLIDLAILTDTPEYRERALEAMEAFGGAWDRIGIQLAGYGSLTARLLGEPLIIEVGGSAGSELHRAACRVADHERVIIPDAEGLKASEASVRTSDEPPVDAPEQLIQQVSAAVDQ